MAGIATTGAATRRTVLVVDLALPFPPEPEFMARHAETAVALIAEFEAIHLDYSTNSLEVIDEVIVTMRGNGETLETVSEALFAFGAYVGEVLVRTYDCSWVAVAGSPPQVKLLGDQLVNPIARAFRGVEEDAEGGFVDLLQVLVTADQAEDLE